jgi:hypothetical protein
MRMCPFPSGRACLWRNLQHGDRMDTCALRMCLLAYFVRIVEACGCAEPELTTCWRAKHTRRAKAGMATTRGSISSNLGVAGGHETIAKLIEWFSH